MTAGIKVTIATTMAASLFCSLPPDVFAAADSPGTGGGGGGVGSKATPQANDIGDASVRGNV